MKSSATWMRTNFQQGVYTKLSTSVTMSASNSKIQSMLPVRSPEDKKRFVVGVSKVGGKEVVGI